MLAHPLTRDLDLDDPRTTLVRREVLARKALLTKIYEEWYRRLANELPSGAGAVLELGAGAGFLDRFVPQLLRSEVFCCSGLELALDAVALPFGAGALRGLAMVNVLHHLAEPERFFAEVVRCLRPGGVLTMIEPWVTPWSTRVYRRLHHETFDPSSTRWSRATNGPLSDANGALPWIALARDRALFEAEFPELEIRRVDPLMPFAYLLSGGFTRWSAAPGMAYAWWRACERWSGLERRAAMFAHLTLVRRGSQVDSVASEPDFAGHGEAS